MEALLYVAMNEPPQFNIEEVRWEEACAQLRAIRREVFVVEQHVPEALEWDGIDGDCAHVLARSADGSPIGTGRLLPDGHIGRMAVLKAWRRRGVGSALLTRLMELARRRGLREVALNAQTYAIPFYAGHGFRAVGEEFMEAGIPHRAMVLSLTA